ncbi:required for excision 1-B domain-containing protein isoform X2 [Hemibagrus wyckioides]|uniref:required for excision 1-B domain-containing protein isoform X2 n=1 Tax=Hemibagrus wyckioides TaxID=337641 RepID=UPI00266C7D75|nr:required for excision 1-B domain-containing protein isoform X2 [Hemibagrus wyckioides]
MSVEMSTANAAMFPSDFKSVVRRFYELQAERVEAYKLFEEGHEAYLRTGPHYDFEQYRQLVHEITKAFCGISKEVLEIKERLHQDFERPDLSEHLEKLQMKEKQKLELTATYSRNIIVLLFLLSRISPNWSAPDSIRCPING